MQEVGIIKDYKRPKEDGRSCALCRSRNKSNRVDNCEWAIWLKNFALNLGLCWREESTDNAVDGRLNGLQRVPESAGHRTRRQRLVARRSHGALPVKRIPARYPLFEVG